MKKSKAQEMKDIADKRNSKESKEYNDIMQRIEWNAGMGLYELRTFVAEKRILTRFQDNGFDIAIDTSGSEIVFIISWRNARKGE